MTNFSPKDDKKVTDSYIAERDTLQRTRVAILLNTVNQNDTVLDLCCGIGETARILTQYFGHSPKSIASFDCSAAAIAEAVRQVPDGDFTCIALNAENLTLDKARDVVIVQAAIHWIKEDLEFLIAALKLAKKRLYLSTTRESYASEDLAFKNVANGEKVEYFRRRYTSASFLFLVQNAIVNSNIDFDVDYYEMQDPFGKTWMNVVINRHSAETSLVTKIINTNQSF